MNYEQISSQDSENLERIPSMEYEDLEIDENAKDIEEYQKARTKN